MPFVKFVSAKKYFIFCQKNILVKISSTEKDSPPELPDEKFFRSCAERLEKQNKLDDLICEMPQDYCALKASADADSCFGADEGYAFIPLREFSFLNPASSPAALRAKGILFWHDTYRHCPKCGARFTEDKAETALVCTECAFKLYPRIEPAVIVLIHRGDEILLVKNKHSGARFYSCIAGFVELGESALDAVVRETREEVGIELENIRAAGSQSWPFPDQLMLAYHADYKGGELKLQEDEIAEARWFKMNELPPKEELPGRGSVAWNLIFGNA